MLQANKAQLLARLALNTLSIRQLELRYWMSVFDRFGVIAALLGGFASSVMIMDLGRRVDFPLLHLMYLVSATGALGFNMLLLVISVMCSLWGPGKALTGRGSNSYNQVIVIMEDMYEHCIVFFRLGLVCYFLTSVFAVFCLFNLIGSIVITVVLGVFAKLLRDRAKHIRQLFIPHRFSSGTLRGNPVQNIAERATADPNNKLHQRLCSPECASKA
eukprot:GHVQ01018474.1.p1 GENE.GHVQ01018474.1~~GHVQ01018474.1.p1  ORF type:complete len:216 (-),score=14.03 GHVQ01018474.1:2285-2932(-)